MTAAAPVKIRELADPKLLASVEDLQLVARWVVEGFMHGLHRSPYVGFSVDFASHREYIPGDDIRHLNWKVYGRQDRLYIKQYDAETNVDLHLVLDISGSMTIGDEDASKLRYAVLLCASLAHLAEQQRDAVGLTLFADRVVEHFRAKAGSDHLLSLLSALAAPRTHPRATSARVLHEIADLVPRRGLVVVISDLYFDTPELLSALDHFRHYGHDLLIFHVLAPLERRMPVDGAVKLVDVETGESLETMAHEIRASFTAAVGRWLDELHTACLARDIDHVNLVTDQPLDTALMDYCVRRSHLF
ncbi:MAG TPA: DUF58 domain-containing protein [Planctomycetaceae bacterium]|jgi:uncharacterized protein (DUF58 family)|nr:DUF58 domain-containing protein [Planctomycetaceae bacterium]